MSDEKIVEFLDELSQNQEFQHKVAYAKIFYLGEKEMIEQMNI